MIRLLLTASLIALSAPALAQEVPGAGVPAGGTVEPGANGYFEVSLDDGQQALSEALVAEGAGDKVTAMITSTRQKSLYYSKEPVTVAVKTLKHDDDAKTFSANLLFMNGNDVISAMPVSGRFDETVSVPMLSKRLKNGDVITESDITWKDFPQGKLPQDTITEVSQLIGATPRRTVANNRPIRADEVQAPAMVKKGGSVQMTYKSPYMTVQTLGEALEDGSEGARIRVKNADSHAVVYATVASAGEVIVGSGGAPSVIESPHAVPAKAERPAPAGNGAGRILPLRMPNQAGASGPRTQLPIKPAQAAVPITPDTLPESLPVTPRQTASPRDLPPSLPAALMPNGTQPSGQRPAAINP